jgi:hypothetical protein
MKLSLSSILESWEDGDNSAPTLSDNNAIADWIQKKSDNAGFQDMARAVRQGDMEKARALAKRYRNWFSEYEVEFFKKNGLL